MTIPPPRILVVEDERDLADGLANALGLNGFEAEVAYDGDTGLRLALEGKADLIVLDLMLPGRSGTEVCREVRGCGIRTPIIMLTARAEIADRVAGLEQGADDYVTKPFSVLELIARIRARLRVADVPPTRVQVGDATVDFGQYRIFRDGREQPLTDHESRLLRLLLAEPNQVISRDRILDEVWGKGAYPSARTIDTFIYRLRQKLESDPKEPVHLLTVHGVGDRYVPATGTGEASGSFDNLSRTR